jgi:hypothetical protein
MWLRRTAPLLQEGLFRGGSPDTVSAAALARSRRAHRSSMLQCLLPLLLLLLRSPDYIAALT